MKKFLAFLLVITACSAERIGTSQNDDPLGEELVSVTINNEYTSEVKKLPNRRLAKRFNGTSSNSEPDHQSYVTRPSNEYYSSTEQPGHRFGYVERIPSNQQQYLLPVDDRNTFNVIPQQENKVSNQHFLPPLNSQVSQQYVQPQQPSVQYLPPNYNQYNPLAGQYVHEQNNAYASHHQFIPQNIQHSERPQNPYFNVYEPQPPNENQFPSQYLLPASTNALDNRYSHFINPIDLYKLNQNTHASTTERNPKEHAPRPQDNYSIPQSTRRNDTPSPAPPQYGNNQIYQEVTTTPSYYSTHAPQTPQHAENQTKLYFNQFNNEQAYETTTPSVVEIGHNNNFPKWMSHSPSFANRQRELYSTTKSPPIQQSAQSRDSYGYGEKINYQQPFASARSSIHQAQVSEKRDDSISEHESRYVPQIPSQFKPSAQISPNSILNEYHEQQSQPSYARTFQQPIPYRPGPTTEPMPILKQTAEMDIDGTFSYETLTGDQTHIMQQGHIENRGTDHEEQVMHGSYSFVGDDGITYTVTYIADSNGFRATGDHIPTAPPIPEVIQRSIEINMAEEAAQAAQEVRTPQGYQYPQADTNNRYPVVVEQAREKTSTLPVYDYNAYNSNIKY